MNQCKDCKHFEKINTTYGRCTNPRNGEMTRVDYKYSCSNFEPFAEIKAITQDYQSIAIDIAETLRRKNHDYGDSFSKIYQKYGMLSTVIRLSDKIGRLETLLESEAQVDEPTEDTLKDICSYCILTLNEMRKA